MTAADVVAFAEAQGVTLLPWQVDVLRAAFAGQPLYLQGGRRARGVQQLREIVGAFEFRERHERRQREQLRQAIDRHAVDHYRIATQFAAQAVARHVLPVRLVSCEATA